MNDNIDLLGEKKKNLEQQLLLLELRKRNEEEIALEKNPCEESEEKIEDV
jgi:hypothetical protein